MRDRDIELALRVEFPEIAMYCADESQERLKKVFKKMLKKYGEDRFCAEVAVFARSIMTKKYAKQLREIKEGLK